MNIKKTIKRALLHPRALYLGAAEQRRLARATGRRKIYYLMGLNEGHRNLGDQAQGVAIRQWFKNHFPEFEVYEYRCHEKFDHLPLIDREITERDLVFLHSGGNFGDTWPVTESIRQNIIRRLRGHSLIQLPQTIHFSDTPGGRSLLESAQRVIGTHGNMIIMGRDLTSAELARSYFPGCAVGAYPDMVLSLAEHYRPRYPRPERGAKRRLLLIMRNDKEGIFDDGDIDRIKGLFSDREVVVWDTDVHEVFQRQRAKSIIERYLDYIASFDHVITDRYHGLIFSVIVNRPCVVLPTMNHKITSAAAWFAILETVRFAPSIDALADEVAQAISAPSAGTHDWDAVHFRSMAEWVRTTMMSPA